MIEYVYKTPFDMQNLKIVSCDGVLKKICFTEEKADELRPREINDIIEWLDEYFSGVDPEAVLRTEITGVSLFCKNVLSLLTEIPYGSTVTYGELAERYCERFGCKKMSAQAIGGALARNPLVIIIPCHRVVGSKGTLVGFSGGISNKKILLDIEKKGLM